MPTHKDLKRLVRRRMQKTGESYTAARAHLVNVRPPVPTPVARLATPDYAKLAGMSDAAVEAATGCNWKKWGDAAVEAATGCNWKKWVDALDYAGAHEWPHRRIAEHLHQKFGVRQWWTQAVTVGYERIRGLREIGQRRGGNYEANKSRTFSVPVTKLFDAFAQARPRARWLPGVKLQVRKATRPRSLRITWDDGTSVEVWLVAKGPAKSSAQVQHRKLPTREAIARTKAFWEERLDALEALLTP